MAADSAVAFCEQNASEITAPARAPCHPHPAVGRCVHLPVNPRGCSLATKSYGRALACPQAGCRCATSPADSGPATVESLGRQLRDVLPTRRLHSVSLCDHEANVLWLSEGALGPDEHSLVVEALELLSADTSLPLP